MTSLKNLIRIQEDTRWEMVMTKKIQVSFSDKQIELLETLKGEFGETGADVVRNVVIAWLAEKSFISTMVKRRITAAGAQQED